MKIVKIVFVIIISILSVSVLVSYMFYHSKTNPKKYVDLFIVDLFGYLANSFNVLDENGVNEQDIYAYVKKEQRRPMTWELSKKEFEVLDSVTLNLTNNSNEVMYYSSELVPRIRTAVIVYKKGIGYDTSGGFGCGSVAYLEQLKKNETIISKELNPLLFNPHTGYQLPLKSLKFPKLFKELYGDSVKVLYELPSYGNPWNTYPPQIICSDPVTLYTDKILENWRKGLHTKSPEFNTDYERKNAFYTRENKK